MTENVTPDDKNPSRISSFFQQIKERRETPRTQAQIDWVKAVLNLPSQDIEKYNWDKAASLTYLLIPPELSDELFDNIVDGQVMFPDSKHTLTSSEVEAGGTENGHRINDLILSSHIKEDEIDNLAFFIFDLINSFTDGVAIAIDSLTPTSINVNSLIGLIPNNKEDVDNKIPDELKAIREAGTVIDKLHNSITVRDLEFIQKQYKKMFGDDSVNNAKWYFNSSTALEIANLKNYDGSYWMDHSKGSSIATVGVPDSLMGSEIIYNEWMEELYDNKAIPIIYGDLRNVYYLGFYPDIKIIRLNDFVDDNGDNVLEFAAQLKVCGDVDLTERINGKLPYIGLRNVITGGNSKEDISDPKPGKDIDPDDSPDDNQPEPEIEDEELTPEFA